MNLLVDVGNSRIKWALADGEALNAPSALTHHGEIGACLDRVWTGLPKPDRIVIAAVVSDASREALSAWITKHWSVRPEFVGARATGYGVRNTYAEPERLGADRWAALIGARQLFAGAVCVIDCGTALTFNVLGAEGDFLGGVILPGLTTARRCLAERTHAIAIEAGNEANIFARNTADAVAAGTARGLAGAVEALLEEYRAKLGVEMRVVLTGGDADTVRKLVRIESTVVPDLVIRGLAHIARTEQ